MNDPLWQPKPGLRIGSRYVPPESSAVHHDADMLRIQDALLSNGIPWWERLLTAFENNLGVCFVLTCIAVGVVGLTARSLGALQ